MALTGFFSGLFTNDSDGVVSDEDGRVLSFRTETALAAHAAKLGVSISEEEPTLHDLDQVESWSRNPHTANVDCSLLLAAWNMLDDIRKSLVGVHRLLPTTVDAKLLYDKLFFGNNLPAITPERERYEPSWSLEEVAYLANVLTTGLELFRRSRREVV